ncbi:MAG TPA: amino acid adenylation domain-containing protein [Fimbriiglobus sp.]|jgi:amino acid adenylation domain-containing protein
MTGPVRPHGIEGGVAIVGMAGRFPRAQNVNEFWHNVRDGIDCISRFTASDIEVSGSAEKLRNPDYVAARSVLDDVENFDAAFFGILPNEAELIDPQHRVFLEICWQALEDAGYVPQSYPGEIGVYAGCSASTYFLRNLCTDRRFIERFAESYQVEQYSTLMGMLPDCLATRVSYRLGLRGPSMTLQTACSTSLVAVCQAAQSLLNFQCDMALAGGVSITFPQRRGALYQEGGMISPDGHCRAFDANANGTVFGSGAGVVLLKRLEDAEADGDHVYAVIRGFAVNNDGSTKVGYTAPSVDGQSRVIAAAHAMAGVTADSISYVETHGTGTPLGDPIEFAALDRVFRTATTDHGFCTLGTVKRIVGHLDVAAGVTGLINAIQALVNETIPPAAGFEKPNPNINLTDSAFTILPNQQSWPRSDSPRRAGVSAFGVGGTNAHVVLEEAPLGTTVRETAPAHLLVLSARTPASLDRSTKNLAAHLTAHPDLDLGDVAHTLQVGRRPFEHRRAVAGVDRESLIRALEGGAGAEKVVTSSVRKADPPVAFLFPGQGAQRRFMAAGLYRDDTGFRADLDACADILTPHLGLDLRTVLYSEGDNGNVRDVTETRLAQPALFAVEYAMAKYWMRRGVQPRAMIGHSIGEFVAACLAGVFSLDDGLKMVAARGRLMQELAPGSMLSVRLPEAEVRSLLNGELSLAAVNSPILSVVSGPVGAIEHFNEELTRRGVSARRLATSHAFHSRMVEPAVDRLAELFGTFRFRPPTQPYISCVSGTWVEDAEATDPLYWARQCREAVQFARGVQTLGAFVEGGLLLEVGPGRTLSTLAAQNLGRPAGVAIVPSLPESLDGQSDSLSILQAAGVLWVNGIELDWPEFHAAPRRRCSLPTYAFDRKRYWIDPPPEIPLTTTDTAARNSGTTEMNNQDAQKSESELMRDTAPAHPTASRTDRIRSALVVQFGELSGLPIAEQDAGTNFLELGFDSLFLTQAAQALQSKFGVKVAFRKLLDELSSLQALAVYLDAQLPPDAFAESAPTVTPAPAVPVYSAPSDVGTQGSSTTVEAVVREQLQAMQQLMARQLEMLRGGAVAASSPVVPSPTPVVPVSTSAPARATTPAAATGTDRFTPFRPVQKGSNDGLTERQSRYLKDLIGRYTAKTAGSKRLTQSHRRTLADPRVAAGFRSQWKEMVYPLVVDRSRGSRLWDVDGNEYIDILNGFGPIMLGHAPEFVTTAVSEQIQRGFEIGPLTPLAGQVADLICEMTGMERASFCGTGSEAVMAALRLARTVTGRTRIVLFAGSYHGNFGEVLVKTAPRGSTRSSLAAAPGIPPEMVANATVLEYGSSESLDYIRAHAEEFAAVLVEPVQSRHPALQPVEFLREIRRITEKSGTALIFDEVVTGFRSHPGGVQALFGIRADLATYGKVIGGGMPIGVVTGSSRFMDALDGGYWQYGDESFPEAGVTFFAGTFFRHPLSLVAALAVLRHLKSSGPDLQKTLNEKTTRLVGELNRLFEARGVPTHIDHFASFFYLSFPPDQRFGSLLYYHLREKGVHIQESYPCFLSTAHTDQDLEFVLKAFRESIHEMEEGGVLPGPSEAQPTTVTAQPTTVEVALTPSQLEILLSAQMGDESSCAFNESFTLHLRGTLDRKALASAVQSLVDRHDALRATFDTTRGIQRIHSHVAVDVSVVDLSGRPEADRSAELHKLIFDDAAVPFNLETGPVVRASLVALTPDHHALVFTAHHIVCDGWSANVLLDDLGKLYTAARGGVAATLPAPSRYVDYITHQEEWARSSDFATVEAYWTRQYASPVSPLSLPIDRPRAAVKSSLGDTVRHTIDRTAYQEIRRFGTKQGCTLFSTLLAGFEILIHRLSSQSDFAVGIPAAGQSKLEGEPLVGHCVNFLPLRCTFEDRETVGQTLARAKTQLLDAYDHQDYTYGTLVRKLNIPRDPSRLPLVEVQFNVERLGGRLEIPGLEAKVDPNPKRFVNFDLFVNVVETEDGLVLDCDYNTDLYDRATVVRWLKHYATLLRGMAVGTDRAVATIPLIEDAEQRLVVSEWNATRRDFPREKCVHQLIQEQAARTPNSVAITADSRRLTYGELDAEADRLARKLRSLGVGAGKAVAIYLDPCPELVVAALGVWKAGGCYVPLDPAYPSERVAAVLEDSRPHVVVTQKYLAPELPPLAAPFVLLDVDSVIDGPPIDLDRSEGSAKPDDLAYIIYTSGSTGRPKGVEVPHQGVVNFLTSMAREPGLSADDTLLAVTTFAFDIAVLELFLPLTVGARVVMTSRTVAADGYALQELLVRSGATVLQATPATWRLILEAGWPGNPRLKALCGGEALTRDLADALLPRCASLWNMYGPTETTVWSSALRVEPGTFPVPVGPPIANTTFYVLDKNGQPTPVGVPGELYIGGEGVVRGYANLPGLTAEKFVPDPFAGDSRSRLYRTGDLVRFRPDGAFEFLGRLDTQVKIRGFRIETSEVESALVQHPAVSECVVVAHEFSPVDKRLVAYLVVNGSTPEVGELRGFVATKLPPYMVPAIFVPLDALPRTPNGKVDRRSLPKPENSIPKKEGEYVAPKNLTERKLAEICAEVLGLKRVGVQESLFDLGADSLHMFQIVARAFNAGIKVTLKQILAHRTVVAISEELEAAKSIEKDSASPPLVSIARDQYRTQRNLITATEGRTRRDVSNER